MKDNVIEKENIEEQENLLEKLKFFLNQFEQNNNSLIKTSTYKIINEIYNNLIDEKHKAMFKETINNINKQINDIYSNNYEIDEYTIKEYFEFILKNIEKINDERIKKIVDDTNQKNFNFSIKCIGYIEIHKKNLYIIKDLLNSCKQNLYKLKNEINKLSKKNISEKNLFLWEFKEIISIASFLRHCIEIVIWWMVKYSDDTTIDKILKKLKKRFWAGRLFEIYMGDETLKTKIQSIDYEKSDFLHTKNISVKEYCLWDKENIKKIYSDLSSLIHYDVIEHINEEQFTYKNKTAFLLENKPENIKEIIEYKKNILKRKYDFLNLIYEQIYESLQNHMVTIDSSGFRIYVKNFDIDIKKIINLI